MPNGKQPNQLDLSQHGMMFGAIVKALQGSLNTENVIPTCDKVWEWTKATLAEASIGLPKHAEDRESRPSTENTENPRKISKKQRKRLFALANKAELSPEELKYRLKYHYDIDSTYKIPWQQYDEICTAIEENTWPY